MRTEGVVWGRADRAGSSAKFVIASPAGWEVWRRLGVFLGAFILVAAAGLSWVWARPPVFESHSLLQIHFEPAVPHSREEHRGEELAFHRELLTSRHLMNGLSERMLALGTDLSVLELERMLGVSTLEDSRVVHLHATALEAELPASVLREWEMLYRQRFLEQREENVRSEARYLDDQIALLERQQEQKQREFAAYQQVHSIASIERDEHRVLNRIKGLAASLDRASEERQRREAVLESLQAAARRGDAVVRSQDQQSIDHLERRANDLEFQIKELAGRYTDRYLDINTRAVTLQNRLLQLRGRIDERRAASRQLRIEEARRQLDAAVVQEQTLETDLRLQEQRVQEFNRRMYELQERRLRLDQQALELGALRAQRNRLDEGAQPVVRVSLLEPPYVPSAPSRPAYWRDSAVALGAALVAAVAALLIYRTIVPVMWPEVVFRSLPDTAPEKQIGAVAAPLTLAHEAVLSATTCRALLESASDPGRLTLMLLLSGVNLREIVSLCWYHLDLQRGQISVPSTPPRDLTLPGRLARFLTDTWRVPENKVTPLLVDAQGHPQSPAQLERLIAEAAVAAELDDRERITARRVEYTYLVFLAEQGLGYEQLVRQLGALPPDVLDRLGGRLPGGPERLLEEVNRIYPALA